MTLPPVMDGCCGQPCFFADCDPALPCWGQIVCIDTEYDEESGDEWRHAACEGHAGMYPSYDKSDYVWPAPLSKA